MWADGESVAAGRKGVSVAHASIALFVNVNNWPSRIIDEAWVSGTRTSVARTVSLIHATRLMHSQYTLHPLSDHTLCSHTSMFGMLIFSHLNICI